MSVLVKGLAMDFVRQERSEMAITGIWPAAVCVIPPNVRTDCIQKDSSKSHTVHRIRRNRIQQIGRQVLQEGPPQAGTSATS